jgi:predicted Zn-dependent peptidase
MPMTPEPELITLKNGVRLALDPMPSLHTAAVGAWVRVGARWEAASENGVAHLFEHMAFKGAGGRDAQAFAEAIETVGGSMNAATGYERTAYYARVTKAHAAYALDLIADIMLAPHWEPAELEKEKAVVRQEMGEAFDAPDDRVFEVHQAALYPDQPLGRPILGSEETLSRITVDTLSAFRESHLTGGGLIIAAAGAYDRDALIAAAEARFGGLPRGEGPPPEPARPQAAAAGEVRKLEQTHLVMSWPGLSTGSDAAYAQRLMVEIFGGGMASRLFQEVREKRGLAYAIDAYSEAYDDLGRIGVYAGCDPKDASAVAGAVQAVLEGLAERGPTEAELMRAKAMLSAGLLMGAESPASRAEARASQVFIRNALIPFETLAARFEAVTAQEVQARARAALEGPAVRVALGPKAGVRAVVGAS